MNRKQFIRRIAEVMREENIRKSFTTPKKVLHIIDDDGNKKDFVIKSKDKDILFTIEDVERIIDKAIFVIQEQLKQGEPITIQGFGSLGLKYRKARATKKVGTDEWIDVDERYVPKFSFGNTLRLCARIYEQSLEDMKINEPLPVADENEDDG